MDPIAGGKRSSSKDQEAAGNQVLTTDEEDQLSDIQDPAAETCTQLLLQNIMEGLNSLDLHDVSHAQKSRALVMASRRGLVECVAQLLEAGANPNSEDEYGYTPLMFLAAQGLDECMLEMLPSCVANKRTDSQQTALHFAAGKGHQSTVKILLEHGALVNAADDWGETPLILAVTSGCKHTVKLLLGYGARLHMTDLRGYDAMMHAAKNGHVDIINLLLEIGVDPNKSFKSSALHMAASFGHHDCVATLMDAGAEMNIRDIHGHLPIELATQTDQSRVVSYLLQQGAPKEHIDASLAASAFWNATKCLQVLLNFGANPNAVDSHGIPAFFLAIAQNNADMVVSLIQHNCNVNKPVRKVYFFNTELQQLCTAVTSDLILPLHIAVLRGYGRLVQILIAAGALTEQFHCLLEEGLVPSTILHNSELMAWLTYHRAKATATPSLRDLCRKTIRSSLPSQHDCHIHLLPLPSMLQDYLAFKELNQFMQQQL